MMRVVMMALTLLLLVMQSAALRAELTIEITQGYSDAVNIAVVPFDWAVPGRAVDVAGIVSADLERSGQFRSLAEGDMLSWPTRKDDIFWNEWRVLKVDQRSLDYLLIGKTERKGDRYEVYFELYDVRSGLRIERGSARAGDIRNAAHYVSDIVYEKITGQAGVFSTRLLYVTVERTPGKPAVYRLEKADADGHNQQTILRSTEPVMSPDWAPDGVHVAYVSFQNKRPEIFIQNTITGVSDKITNFPRINGAPSFSPDGKKLAMALSKGGNLDVYVYDLETKSLQRVTKHYRADTEPSWFPDGQSLLFTSDRAGAPQIYRVDLKAGKTASKPRRVTFEGRYNARGQVTPDGRNLVMVSGNGNNYFIAVQDLKSGLYRILTDNSLDESPSVAPNGSMVIYATQERGESVLAVVSLDGQVKVRLPSSRGGVREPVWSPFVR